MFESDFMEFFSRVHPVDSVDSVPACRRLHALCGAFGGRNCPVFVVVGFFLLGMLLWTLLEYLIHRYIFHYEPKTRVGKTAALYHSRRASRLSK